LPIELVVSRSTINLTILIFNSLLPTTCTTELQVHRQGPLFTTKEACITTIIIKLILIVAELNQLIASTENLLRVSDTLVAEETPTKMIELSSIPAMLLSNLS